MYSPLAMSYFQSLLAHMSAAPVSGGVFAGIVFSFFRRPFRALGVRESESLMNFSSLGTLRCICGTEHMDAGASDRRQFCRSCGCEVVAQNASLLDKQLSGTEIRKMTRDLKNAAIRASRLELPPSIHTLEDLQRYLASDAEKNSSPTPPTRPTTVGQPQVH